MDIKHEIGAEADLKKVEEALQGDTKFKLVCLTQVDTSTGVLNNIKELAALVKKHQPDALIAVDGVCSFGAEEFRFDEWGIDACMTASQKALGVPPGLLVAALSQRALQVNKERKTRVNNYFLRLSNWLPIMQKYENRQPCYFATPPVNLIRYGVHELTCALVLFCFTPFFLCVGYSLCWYGLSRMIIFFR